MFQHFDKINNPFMVMWIFLFISQMKTLRKLKREPVPAIIFSLNKVHGSPWEQVISPIRPDDDCPWNERYRGRKGYRKSSIFGGKTFPAAAYEFSVRKQSDPTRSVTYCKLSSGFTSARSWEARLLCHSDVRAQVNRVVGLGYSVLVRRCLLNDSNKDTVEKSLLRYDYAWNRVKDSTSFRRDATAV